MPEGFPDVEVCDDDTLIEYVNHQNLRYFPQMFIEILEEIQNRELDIKYIINSNDVYEIWYSTLAHCVIYLVGNPNNPDNGNLFYGNNESIPPLLGVQIFNLLVELGANLNIQSYYGDTIFDYINYDNFKDSLIGRNNNRILIDRISEIYDTTNLDNHPIVVF